MDTIFIYNRFAVGNDFISRKREVNILTNNLRQRQHSLIYDAHKTGKKSLVQQTILNLQKLSYDFRICDLNLLNIRSMDKMFKVMVTQIASSISNTLTDWNEFSEKYLNSSEINPDSEVPLTDEQILEIISIPEKISKESGINFIVYIENFNNILLFDDSEALLKLLEKEWAKHNNATYLITGSELNAMKWIFEEQKFFYNFAEYIPLSPLEEKGVADHIIRTFLKVGRVVDPDLATTIYKLVDGHPWYVWQISSICFSLTKGYLNDKIIQEATYSVLALHEPRFKEMISGLSNFQINLLRAVFDGITRFSSAEILEKYSLNSSANVHRLKEALKKKEIITFNEQDDPLIIDPLFKLWLQRYFFV